MYRASGEPGARVHLVPVSWPASDAWAPQLPVFQGDDGLVFIPFPPLIDALQDFNIAEFAVCANTCVQDYFAHVACNDVVFFRRCLRVFGAELFGPVCFFAF